MRHFLQTYEGCSLPILTVMPESQSETRHIWTNWAGAPESGTDWIRNWHEHLTNCHCTFTTNNTIDQEVKSGSFHYRDTDATCRLTTSSLMTDLSFSPVFVKRHVDFIFSSLQTLAWDQHIHSKTKFETRTYLNNPLGVPFQKGWSSCSKAASVG